MGITQMGVSTHALAVGNGLAFAINENTIDANTFPNWVNANSLDLTYHACTQVNAQTLQERGYFWLSSYQDIDSVVDSQINYDPMFGNNGYHLYGKYQYTAAQVGAAQPAVSGNRLNYQVNNGAIELYTDPLQDTTLSLVNCQIVRSNANDDVLMGTSVAVVQGEKSETNGLANGDFELIFGNWTWANNFGQKFISVNGAPFNFLHFNANLTQLGGPLGQNHNPEGSGNIFWRAIAVGAPIAVEAK